MQCVLQCRAPIPLQEGDIHFSAARKLSADGLQLNPSQALLWWKEAASPKVNPHPYPRTGGKKTHPLVSFWDNSESHPISRASCGISWDLCCSCIAASFPWPSCFPHSLTSSSLLWIHLPEYHSGEAWPRKGHKAEGPCRLRGQHEQYWRCLPAHHAPARRRHLGVVGKVAGEGGKANIKESLVCRLRSWIPPTDSFM